MHVISERNLSSVDLNLLVAFDSLMAERNVTRAAERNGLTQPAVSKALNRLRYLFDDPLFVRRDRAMEPTARALELAGPIRGALADISRTLTLPATFDPATVRATVKIATMDLYHTNLLPALIRHLRRHAPGVDLQVRANDCYRLHEPMSIESYAAAAHLVDAGHVQVSADGVGTSVVDAILAARGLRRRIVLVLPSSAGVPFGVAATDLIATLPSRIVKGLVPMANVRMLTPPLPEVEVSPHMFWHRRTYADPLQIWLRTMIREIAAG